MQVRVREPQKCTSARLCPAKVENRFLIMLDASVGVQFDAKSKLRHVRST